MDKRKRRKYIKKNDFFIMNKDAMYFSGMSRGDVKWSNDQSEAKIFHTPSKIEALKRWKPYDKVEIVYCSEI